jgi:hypothetical protein
MNRVMIFALGLTLTIVAAVLATELFDASTPGCPAASGLDL